MQTYINPIYFNNRSFSSLGLRYFVTHRQLLTAIGSLLIQFWKLITASINSCCLKWQKTNSCGDRSLDFIVQIRSISIASPTKQYHYQIGRQPEHLDPRHYLHQPDRNRKDHRHRQQG